MEAIIYMVGRGRVQGVYQFTRIHGHQIILVDYDRINAEAFSLEGE